MSWFDRSDSENFNRNVAFLKRHVVPLSAATKAQLVLFSHVPKTAGTSLESYLMQQFKMSDVLHVNAPDLNRLPEVLKMKKHFPQLICGHHPMHGMLYQLLPEKPLIHFTVLRDPVSRVVSYFNYICGKPDHPLHVSAISSGLDDFIIKAPSPELNNGQSRRFAGQLHQLSLSDDELFETARSVLSTCFSLLMTSNHLSSQLLGFSKDMDWQPPTLPQLNRSKQSIRVEDLHPTTRALIVEKNQADQQLFDWVEQKNNR